MPLFMERFTLPLGLFSQEFIYSVSSIIKFMKPNAWEADRPLTGQDISHFFGTWCVAMFKNASCFYYSEPAESSPNDSECRYSTSLLYSYFIMSHGCSVSKCQGSCFSLSPTYFFCVFLASFHVSHIRCCSESSHDGITIISSPTYLV